MSPRTRLLLDTDPGIDDAMALAMLARDPRADLIGITTVFGNGPVEQTTRNALSLRERFGLAHVPVARGAARLLVRDPAPFADHVHGRNGLGDVEVSAPTLPLDPRPAARFIVDMVHRHPGELVLVPVGPLTNMAEALRLDPTLPRHVRAVVAMGGAFGTRGHDGNVTPFAEANIHADPHAADLVAAADWPVTFVGLDVTHEVVMPGDYLDDLGARGGPIGAYLREITRFYEAVYRRRNGRGICCHDATAVACALDASAFTRRHGPVQVTTDGEAAGQTRQETVPHATRPAQQVCIDADVPRLLAHYRRLFDA
jgi:inosine-uridine nucleoside N-ribohydrolase